MNKHIYRLIFNRARGMLMAVAETAMTQGRGDGAGSSAAPLSLAASDSFQLKSILVLLGVAWGIFTTMPAQSAGIVADPSAPASQRPTVLNAGNGVPLVNIQTPSAAGVSRNTYSQFDVAPQGAILNNSRTNAQTQLGGYVQGNPWLAGGSARVILNEVNSSTPSLLNGFIEVAGQRAQVVIANPAGISCDGCGFINANRATLTTGTPIMNGGNLDGYRVTGGTITVQGSGLDARSADYTDIIARAVQVNAGIWANDLKLTTGANQVSADQTQINPITGTGSAPAFAVDVAALGGMYANKIRLIGTEAGVGVRNAGNIGASAGEVTLTADGQLQNSGRITAGGHATFSTSGGITNSGTIYAQGNADLTTQGNIANSGMVAAQGNASLTANGANSRIDNTADAVIAAGLDSNGTLGNTGNLTLTATQSVAAHGKTLVAGDQTLTAQSLDLSGSQTVAQNLTLTASGGNLDASNATVTAERSMAVTVADTFTDNGATFLAGTTLILDSHRLVGNGKLLSQGDLHVSLTSDYTHTGEFQAAGSASLQTSGILTNQASFQAGNQLTLTAAAIDNQSTGSISAQQTHLIATDTHTLTNRGLIDGQDTFIDTVTLNNLGTGHIYGDHVAIAATTITNDTETLNGVTTAAVIAARNRLDIGAATLTNREHALIFSAGDMSIGGSLDTNHQATGQAGTLDNISATIEALGNLTITTATLNNTNAHFSSSSNLSSQATFAGFDMGEWCSSLYSMPGCGPNWLEDHTEHTYTRSIYDPVVTQSDPAQILVGGNLTLYGNTFTNDKSRIIAGGNLTGDLVNLTSIAAEATRKTVLSDQYAVWQGGGDDEYIAFGTNNITTDLAVTLPVTKVQSNTAPVGTGIHINALQTSSVQTVTPNTTLPNNNLFQTSPNPASHYLIETDPRFTNYATWISSDTMLTQLGLDPALIEKRLGDGFYEQQLVREQVAQLTGRRFLTGYASDEAEYRTLMEQGATYARQHRLIPGVALTAAQMAQLTSDIVWLVKQTVTLPNGTKQQALVPQVYVRPQAGDLTPAGTLLAGDNVQFNLTGDLTNSGTIAGRSVVSLTADNIRNLNGRIDGNTTQLTARTDLDNIGGSISGSDRLAVTAGHDLNVVSTTATAENVTADTRFTRTTLDRVAGLYVSNPNGILVASAGNDVNLMAVEIRNTGSNGQTVISAGRDLTLGTVTEAELNSQTWDAHNHARLASTHDLGTTLHTAGDLTLSANRDLTARAANVTSDQGTLAVTAGNSLTIATGTATRDEDTARYGKKSGLLSSTTKAYRNTLDETTAIASTFSGDTVHLQADNNLQITGSNVVSTNGTTLAAGNNVTLDAAEQAHDETHLYQKSKSGVFASGNSLTLGSQKLQTSNNSQQVTHLGSSVGSVNGDVTISAGKDYTQTGSDIIAPQGNIDITASKVDINAAVDTTANQQTLQFKQSGLSVSISNPVISAVQTSSQMASAASQTSDPRMQALATAAVALSAKNTYDAVRAGQVIKDGNLADQAGGINVAVSLGSSKASSESSQTSTQAVSSHVTAGQDVNITATGAGKDSDINVTGSQVTAGNNLALKADDQINLLAAQNTATRHSSNKSSSASIGVSVGIGAQSGVGVTASMSRSKGSSNEADVTHANTLVSADNTLILQSGTDTTLRGAAAFGRQVIAEVGTTGTGNLNIESLQDTSSYNSKQNNAGFSVTVSPAGIPTGGSISSGKSRTNSEYASVNEQSGIKAGDYGFDIQVNGNTDLKGAVMASTQAAIDNQRNQLVTGTLTTSNIANHAQYDANATSVTVGMGAQKGLPQLSGVGAGSDGGQEATTTVSAVSGGVVSITDSAAQQAKAGQDAVATVALLNRDVKVNDRGEAVDSQGNAIAHTITPIFDKEMVQKEINAQVQITQAFDKEQQQFRTEINKLVDTAKAEKEAVTSQLKDQYLSEEQRMDLIDRGLNAQKEIERLENMGLVFSAVAGGLSAPTNSIGGIIANSLAPEAANQIGQYFKDHGTEGTAPHILAHGVLAGAVAALGGNNPMGAAVAAMGGEMIAPLVADYLYGKTSEELNAEQKATVSTIARLSGIAASASIDSGVNNVAQANLVAQNAVDNNWGMIGHYSTMATVLYLAGFSTKDAKAIALAAWGPDTDNRNAITVPNVNNGRDPSQPQISVHLLDGEKDPAIVIATQQKLAEQVREILLTIKQYGNDPSRKAAYLTAPVVQQILHSFGDSFAHVQDDGTHYGPEKGHLRDGTNPDNPSTNADAYRSYANTLFDVASQATASPRVGSSTIVKLTDNVTKSKYGQLLTLYGAIGSVTKEEATSLVRSPVKECGLFENCQKLGVGSQVNPIIRSILGAPKQ